MNNSIKRALAMLSLSAKAGKASSGSFMCEKCLQDASAKLIIIANDASDNTKKKFKDKCTYYDVPYIFFSEGISLGKYIGKQSRMVVAVIDQGIANQIINILGESKDMEV